MDFLTAFRAISFPPFKQTTHEKTQPERNYHNQVRVDGFHCATLLYREWGAKKKELSAADHPIFSYVGTVRMPSLTTLGLP